MWHSLNTWTLLNFILGYVDQAKEEGAEIFQIEVPEALKANKGLYYPPTLITHVNAASTVVMEEVFGPVAVALPFRYLLTLPTELGRKAIAPTQILSH